MGYESRFYIIEKTDKSDWSKREINGKSLYWSRMICRFDMGKIYDVSDRLFKYPETEYFIYGDSEEITEDMYGKPLKEIPLADMVDIVEKAMEHDYWVRYEPFIACLKAFQKTYGDSVAVLHYGY